jgi:glycosyltransferase involved in cell wall biosynthesis
MIFGICFTNFGPYHLARLRALATRLQSQGDTLIAYEVSGTERTYPWARQRRDEPFVWRTLFPDHALEMLEPAACRDAMSQALDHDQPDALGIVGYARPESMAAARWARRAGRPAILMSESQAVDRRRIWWKEMIKRRRIALFDAALVGGPRHRDYLVELGMPPDRIALGYNAVDNAYFTAAASRASQSPGREQDLPAAPYFLTVCRFVPAKNLDRLVRAFARYRQQVDIQAAWDLVICGDGPGAAAVSKAVAESGCAGAIHRPGFLQVDALPRWYAHAGAFVLPSLSEPWGLVANEAAACSLPLLISNRAGCVDTLVPEPDGTTGARFDPSDVEHIAARLCWLAALPESDRVAMGRCAAETVANWGPDQFARGTLEALQVALAIKRKEPINRFSGTKVS